MNKTFTAKKFETVSAGKLRFNERQLLDLERIVKENYNNMNGIIIVKDGYIAYEKYFNGFNSKDTFHVTSVTKSVLSALIGIAIDKSYIQSENQRVLDFFPEYSYDMLCPNKDKVTIHNLLTMTAPYPFENWKEPLEKLCTSPDWIKYTLDTLGQNGEIGEFKYSTAGAHLLSAILTRSTHKSAREFANEFLFNPLGIDKIPDYKINEFGYEELFGKKVKGWVNDPYGNSTGGWGLTLSVRDMAKIGLLYLNKGRWENRQIISNHWIDKSVKANSNNYGYLWWLFHYDGLNAFSAMGDGGNAICVIPEKQLVIAIASKVIINAKDRWEFIKAYILPALF